VKIVKAFYHSVLYGKVSKSEPEWCSGSIPARSGSCIHKQEIDFMVVGADVTLSGPCLRIIKKISEQFSVPIAL
jgi:hypothetical protein